MGISISAFCLRFCVQFLVRVFELNLGFWAYAWIVQGSRFRIRGLGFGVQGYRFGVSGFRFRVSGFGFRV